MTLFTYQHFSTTAVIHPDFFCHLKKLQMPFLHKGFFSVMKTAPTKQSKNSWLPPVCQKTALIWRTVIQRTLRIFWACRSRSNMKNVFICGIFSAELRCLAIQLTHHQDNECGATAKQSHCHAVNLTQKALYPRAASDLLCRVMRWHIEPLFSSIISIQIITNRENSKNSFNRMTTEQQEDKRWQKNAVSPLLPAESEKGHMNHLQNHLLHCVSGHSSLIAMHYWSPFSFFFELATLLYCLINSHLIPSAKRLTSIISYFPISLVGIGTSAGRVELEYPASNLCVQPSAIAAVANRLEVVISTQSYARPERNQTY